MKENGGEISYRTTTKNKDTPYEINISLFDAMKETFLEIKSFTLKDFYAYI